MGLSHDLATLRDFAIAVLIGALVGLEREQRKPQQGGSGVPGIRTFMLLALTGALGAWLSQEFKTPWIFVGIILGVSGMIVAGYILQVRAQADALGLTTELASLAVCLLGALSVVGDPSLAVALGIGVSAVLAFKQPIHGMVRKLGTDDIFAGLKLLIATFIVLPILPDRAVDPWGALNPYKLWLLVVLISGLSLVGYVATRWLGPQRGLALTGVTGGLVSSTAVTLSFARKSRESGALAGMAGPLANGILLAWLVMCIRVVVMVAVVNPAMLSAVALPFAIMATATLVPAVMFLRGSQSPAVAAGSQGTTVPLKNPFSLTAAIKFALFLAVVLLVVKLTQHYLPGRGVLAVAALAGLADVDAITLSMADDARQPGNLNAAVAAIVIAALSNTCLKAGLVVTLGSALLRRKMLAAAGIIVAATAGSLLLLWMRGS